MYLELNNDVLDHLPKFAFLRLTHLFLLSLVVLPLQLFFFSFRIIIHIVILILLCYPTSKKGPLKKDPLKKKRRTGFLNYP